MNRNVIRSAATGGVLLLSLAFSGPASAHESANSAPTGAQAEHSQGDSTVTVAEMAAWVNRAVAAQLRALARAADRIAASERLSAEKKAALNERIQARRATLAELQSKVAAADTKQEIRAAVREAKLFRGCSGWKGDRNANHRDHARNRHHGDGRSHDGRSHDGRSHDGRSHDQRSHDGR